MGPYEFPKIAHSSHRDGSKFCNRDKGVKPTCKSHYLNSLSDELREPGLGKSISPSCKSMPSRLARVPGSAEQKRGSIYQSSNTVRKLKEAGILEETRKIQSCGSDISLTFTIIESLSQPTPNEDSPHAQQKLPHVSLNADTNLTSVDSKYILPNIQEFLDPSFRLPEDCLSAHNICSSDDFLEICLEAEDAKYQSAETVAKPLKCGLVEEPKFRCDQAITPESDNNCQSEKDTIHALQKSFSAKVGMVSPCQLEFDRFKACPKARHSPLRQVLDPIMKSVSQGNPSFVTAKEFGSPKNKAIHRSLLHDFSKTAHKTERNGSPIKKVNTAPSPAHLHGLLKLKHNHGMPFFEFSITDLEDVLGAKTWKTDNAFNWVYTFHALKGKKKSNSTKDKHKPSSMVGQMQASSYLCSEIKNGGSLHNSTVTEFVSYDLAHARRDLAAAQESSCCSPSSIQPTKDYVESNGVWHPDGCKLPARHASGNDNPNTLASHPWGHMDLHPQLETAAIVIQVPFEKRESLKDKVGDKVAGREDINVSDYSAINHRINDVCNRPSLVNVKAVTPSGTHGLPSTEGGPSSLLDRWRSGGGCDCGGWDMACPIVVFECPSVESIAEYPFLENSRQLELIIQGAKEKVPSLSITLVNDGEYCVNFHAQLSTLQAFSISVALLHSVEISAAAGQERNRQRLQCNSLKMLLEEEVRFFMEAVMEEEKRKATNKTEETPPCFVLDPPFSPIGRV